MGVCNCSMFCCTLLYVHSSIAIILMGKRELALLNLSSWCLVMSERLFLAVPGGCLQFVIVVFPDHTQLLFFLVLVQPRKTCPFITERLLMGLKESNQIKQTNKQIHLTTDKRANPLPMLSRSGTTLNFPAVP